MTTIDHSILIPTSQERVWNYISNFNNNPEWQVYCQSVSFLSTGNTGPGTRWRYSGNRQRDVVAEVKSWYDGLGYEYVLLDGVNFKSNRGLLRLQEIPEGTIVQWTFNYELGGMLGGLRDSMGTRRQVESDIIDSMKMLWKVINRMKTGDTLIEAKSLMRDAPDADARSRYKPRHPSKVTEPRLPDGFGEASAIDLFSEPPIAEDDTRPNPAVDEPRTLPPVTQTSITSDAASSISENSNAEPDFLADDPETADNRFTPPGQLDGSPISPFEADTQLPYQTPEDSETPVPVVDERKATDDQPEAPQYELERLDDPSDLDTSRVSVFELFGLPKPSETQEMRAITADVIEPATQEPPTVTTGDTTQTDMAASTMPIDQQTTVIVPNVSDKPASPARVGLRRRLRGISVTLRRP